MQKIDDWHDLPSARTDGFVIDAIELKDFMRYVGKAERITFPDELTVITGKTGAGKTTILDAITFALYGNTSRTDMKGVKISDVCQPGTGYVKLYFRQGENRYEVERRVKKREKASELLLKINGRRITGKTKDLERCIEDIIGLDYIGFCNSTFVRQEEMRALGAETGAPRLEIFQKLFRLNVFETALSLVSKKHGETEFEIGKMETRRGMLNAQIENLPLILDEYNNKSVAVQKMKLELEELKKTIETYKDKFAMLTEKHEAFIDVQVKISETKKNIVELTGKLDNAMRKDAEVSKLKAEAKNLESAILEHESMAEKLNAALRNIISKHDEFVYVNAELNRLRGAIIATAKKLELANQKSKQFEKLQHQVRELEHTIIELEKTIDAHETTLRELAEKHDRLLSARAKLSGLKERIHKITKKLTGLHEDKKRLENLSLKLAKLEADTNSYDKVRTDVERLRLREHEYLQRKRELELHYNRKSELESDFKRRRDELAKRLHAEEGRIFKLTTDIDKDEAFRVLKLEGTLQERIERINKELRWLEGHEMILAEIKTEQTEAIRKLEDVKSKSAKINVDSFLLTEIKSKIRQLTQDITECDNEYNSKLTAIMDQINAINTELKKYEFSERERSQLAELLELLKKQEQMRRELTKLREEKDKLGDTSKLIPELTAELNTHQAELTEIQATVNALEKEEMRYQQLNLDLNTLKSNLKRKKVQLDKQKSECDALGDPTSLIQSLTDELKHRHDELANLTEKQAALQVYEEQYVNYNNEYDKVRNILRVRRNELDKIRHQIDSIGDVSKLIDDLTLQRDTNMQKLAALNTKLEALEPYERDYIPIKQKLDELQRQYAEKLKHVHGGEVELKNLKLQLDELKKKEAELADTERAIDYLRETLEIYTILREHIFHRKGVVMYAINQLLPHLEIVTSRLLAELTDSRLTGVKLEAYEESKGYGIRIQVLGTDKSWRDIREFSGGERTQINAALRFAIAKELVGLPTVGRTYSRMKTLFIDEGDLGSLDTESSRQLFVKKLFDMKKFFDKVILITHLTEVADQFPYQIRITMTPEQESRVVMGGR